MHSRTLPLGFWGPKKTQQYLQTKEIFGETHDMYIVPAFKEDTVVKPGWDKGGLATMGKKEFTKYVSKIKCDIFRIQVAKFNFLNAELLVLNLYFMVDSQNNNMNNLELQLSLLGEIDRILSTTEFKNVLLVGNINCDFSRPTQFVQSI